MKCAALTLALCLAAATATAGEWRRGDLVTFALACRHAEPVQAWAERWARGDPKAREVLAAAVQGEACISFDWPQNGALIEPAGPLYSHSDGRRRQVWRVYAFHQSVFVVFDPEGGPHGPEAPGGKGEGS